RSIFSYGQSYKDNYEAHTTPVVSMACVEEGKAKVGNAYTKYSGFKKEFNKLVTYETCKDAFELKWSSLIRKYNLRDNEFLKRLFYYRRMWAKPYFMDVFCAGMTSTQQSESA